MNNSKPAKQIKIDSRISEIENTITIKKEQISQKILGIQNAIPPIQKDEHFWGAIKTLNTEKSLERLFKKLQGISSDTYVAINDTNTYIGCVLDLMRLLASAENDLYKLLDDESSSSKDLADSVEELLKKSNIKDEASRQFINQSAKRILILRDRIIDLRTYIEDNFVDKVTLDQMKESFQESLRNEISSAQKTIIQDTSSRQKDAIREAKNALDNKIAERPTEKQVKAIAGGVETRLTSLIEKGATTDEVKSLLEPLKSDLTAELSKLVTEDQVKAITDGVEAKLAGLIGKAATTEEVKDLLEPLKSDLTTALSKQLTENQVKAIAGGVETKLTGVIEKAASPEEIKNLLEPLKSDLATELSKQVTEEQIKEIVNTMGVQLTKAMDNSGEFFYKKLEDYEVKQQLELRKQMMFAYIVAGAGFLLAIITFVLSLVGVI